MTKFAVPDMTCGHCEATVTKAIKEVDPFASVKADLATNTITLSSSAEVSTITAALEKAGYPSTAIG
ncbi:heavy-metal-associated domain-containing protein [Maritalea porphyrae]|uniref:Heavy metal-binding protein n=1 Tax=Maritalea porphyrae TaxID=880732 RepID=A0ABQ5UNM7_9HYPH|nr:heavy-metal-associated domain-containing protein [Maritalea porphyrae]GLQ15920.1 heavy metal-binding protein [Maritalea porphyrae]